MNRILVTRIDDDSALKITTFYVWGYPQELPVREKPMVSIIAESLQDARNIWNEIRGCGETGRRI